MKNNKIYINRDELKNIESDISKELKDKSYTKIDNKQVLLEDIVERLSKLPKLNDVQKSEDTNDLFFSEKRDILAKPLQEYTYELLNVIYEMDSIIVTDKLYSVLKYFSTDHSSGNIGKTAKELLKKYYITKSFDEYYNLIVDGDEDDRYDGYKGLEQLDLKISSFEKIENITEKIDKLLPVMKDDLLSSEDEFLLITVIRVLMVLMYNFPGELAKWDYTYVDLLNDYRFEDRAQELLFYMISNFPEELTEHLSAKTVNGILDVCVEYSDDYFDNPEDVWYEQTILPLLTKYNTGDREDVNKIINFKP